MKIDPAERDRISSREAKRRRKRPCERGCGHLLSYDNKVGVCARCQSADRRKWTRETVIAAIQSFAAINGRPPTSLDFAKGNAGEYPPHGCVYRSTGRSSSGAPFQKWADAIEAAGFPRPMKGRHR